MSLTHTDAGAESTSDRVRGGRKKKQTRNHEYCCGPGEPFVEECLGNGKVPPEEARPGARCPTCKVERRHRQLCKRSQNRQQQARPKRKRKDRNRPQSLSEALAEADTVLASQRHDERRKHPRVQWQRTRTFANDGTPVEFDSIDLKHAISDS